jgi:Mrp family chromosome partitioning ATPase
MTRIFVMTNPNGGVGKSTTATNVAFGLAQMLWQANVDRHNVPLSERPLCNISELSGNSFMLRRLLRNG